MKSVNKGLFVAVALILALTPAAVASQATYPIAWTAQIGTSSDDYSYSVAVDGSGNAYITGYTRGDLGGTNAGDYDAFLTKFDNLGNELWSKQIGTPDADPCYSVAVDGSGNVYIAGRTNGSLGGTNAGRGDAFLVKFDSSGNELWSKQIGTSDMDLGLAVAVDVSGNVYITGHTRGSLGGTNAGGNDAFLVKFDSSGNELWSKQIGTTGTDYSFSVAIDASGNAYITGSTYGDLAGTNPGDLDAYLVKFDSSGNELWSRQIGTAKYDTSYSVAVDASGSAYITGYTSSDLGGPYEGGWYDAYLVKFDSSGNLLWSQQIGTSSYDNSYSVAVDGSDNVFITGRTTGDLAGTNAGNWDAFLVKFDGSSSRLWTQQLGTSDEDGARSVAVDDSGNVYITGHTKGDLGGINAGNFDAFLVKFEAPAAPAAPAVTGRYIFYNNSAWDGNDPAPNIADFAAIATNKTALLPGEVASFINYTSYSKGINGVIVDIANMPSLPRRHDFTFKVGNVSDPSGFTTGPDPVVMQVRHFNGGDRATIIFADGAIAGKWLQITHIPSSDVFYFGNAIGETGNSTTDAKVTPADAIGVRNNPHSVNTHPAAIDNAYDFNRDKKVGPTDSIIARNNGTNSSTALQLITAP